MSSNKRVAKALKKKISLIIEIYMDVKGKKKKEKLRQFIEEKVSEIIIYKRSLNAKKTKTAALTENEGDGQIEYF